MTVRIVITVRIAVIRGVMPAGKKKPTHARRADIKEYMRNASYITDVETPNCLNHPAILS
jgi:hypothetical protein